MRRTHIQVGDRLFVIDSTPETSLALSDESLDGDTDLRYRTIRIRHDLDDEQWAETLLHELLHIVWHLTALPHLIEEHEELIVRSLSPWLHALVRIRTAD